MNFVIKLDIKIFHVHSHLLNHNRHIHIISPAPVHYLMALPFPQNNIIIKFLLAMIVHHGNRMRMGIIIHIQC